MSTIESTPVEQVSPIRVPRPKGLPAREEYVTDMLSKTRRPGVPIRRSFVQVPKPGRPDGSRDALLSKLVKSRSDNYLDAYLLIHALASSSEPFEVWYPSQSWVRALGLDDTVGTGGAGSVEAARTQWSKIVRKLVDLKLIKRRRAAANKMNYVLLDESGNEADYERPRDRGDGGWFTIPHIYWTGDFYRTLGLPAKAMLLIALSSPDTFQLPLARVSDWYGISESTARRGFTELEQAGILVWDQDWKADTRSPTVWVEVRNYRLLSPWTRQERSEAMLARSQPAKKKPTFVAQPDDDTLASKADPKPKKKKRLKPARPEISAKISPSKRKDPAHKSGASTA